MLVGVVITCMTHTHFLPYQRYMWWMYGGLPQFSPMVRASKLDENEASLALSSSSVSLEEEEEEEEGDHVVHPSCVGWGRAPSQI